MDKNRKKITSENSGDAATCGPSPGPGCSLSAKWRRLADSWLKAVDGLDPLDSLAVCARTRAQAYSDCADELDKANAQISGGTPSAESDCSAGGDA